MKDPQKQDRRGSSERRAAKQKDRKTTSTMYSMTGFGTGSAPFGKGRLVLEIKTVNHRFLEVRVKAQRDFLVAESIIERLIRAKLKRGYCTVNLSYEGALGGTTAVDQQAVKNHLDQLIQVAEETSLCLKDLVPLLVNAPDIFVSQPVQDETEIEKAVNQAFSEAAASLLAMRAQEGLAMKTAIVVLLDHIEANAENIAALVAEHNKNAVAGLKKRLNTLLGDTEIQLDPGRLEAEAALLADRADITEEIVRLKSHISQMRSVLEAAEASGRRMEFLLQEMVRETNTIGAKTSLATISLMVIDIKADLEKIREMVQNIE